MNTGNSSSQTQYSTPKRTFPNFGMSTTSAPPIRSTSEEQPAKSSPGKSSIYRMSTAPSMSTAPKIGETAFTHSAVSQAASGVVSSSVSIPATISKCLSTQFHVSPMKKPPVFTEITGVKRGRSESTGHNTLGTATMPHVANSQNVVNTRLVIDVEAVLHDEKDAIRMHVYQFRTSKTPRKLTEFQSGGAPPAPNSIEVTDAELHYLLERVTAGCFEKNKRDNFVNTCRKSLIGDRAERFHFELSMYKSISAVVQEFEAPRKAKISNLDISLLPKHIVREIDRCIQMASQKPLSPETTDLFESHVYHGGASSQLSEDTLTPGEPLPFHLPKGLYSTLLPYQREALRFAIEVCDGRVYIADDMGLGKTLEAISLSLHYSSYWPLLIITPSSLKHQWKSELEKWIPMLRPKTTQPTSGRKGNKKHLLPFMEDSKIALLEKAADIDALLTRDGEKRHGNLCVYIISYAIASILSTELRNAAFDIVICDEAHNLKEEDTKRSKAIKEIVSSTSKLILLSGTPALSRPLELFSQLDLLLTGKRKIPFKAYGERYCAKATTFENAQKGQTISPKLQYARKYLSPKAQYFLSKKEMYSGHSHLDELRWLLQKTCLIRRTKNDVLEQLLPKKRRNRIILHISEEKKNELKKRTTASSSSVPATSSRTLEGWMTQSSAEGSQPERSIEQAKPALDPKESTTMQIFFDTSVVKVDAVCEYLSAYLRTCFVREDDKVVIFAHHTEMLNRIESTIQAVRRSGLESELSHQQKGEALEEASTEKDLLTHPTIDFNHFEYVRIDGRTPIAARADFIQRFQTQNDYKIALCSLLAVGVGVNLVAAKTCIFAELYWNPADLIQAEDRIHRLGQKGAGVEGEETCISERSVEIQYLIAKGTFDDSLWALLQKKFSVTSQMLESSQNKANYTLKDKRKDSEAINCGERQIDEKV